MPYAGKTRLILFCDLPYAGKWLKARLFDHMRESLNTPLDSHEATYAGADAPPTALPVRAVAPTTKPLWYRLLTAIIPWALAITGWIAVAALASYSQGLSDRVRTTRLDFEARISDLTSQSTNARVLQDYLALQGAQVLPLKNWVSATSKTRVDLVMAPGLARAIILARSLNPPPAAEIYQIWVETPDGRAQSVGTLTTHRPLGQGMALVAGAMALNRYKLVGLSVEPVPGAKTPTSPLLFSAPLSPQVSIARHKQAPVKGRKPEHRRTKRHK